MRKLKFLLPVALLAPLWLGGCAHIEEQQADYQAEVAGALEPEAAAEKPAARPSAPPAAVEEALLSEIELDSADQERFDVIVDRVPARQFFMGLVRDTPYNMIVNPEVSGSITLELKNVTVDEVMRAVRQAYGYEYERTGNGYVVLPKRLESRVYTVNYLNVDRRGDSETRVSSGLVAGDRDSGIRSTDDPRPDEGDQRSRVSGSRVSTSTRADFWQEVEIATRAIVGDEEGRRIIVSPQSGLVVVRGMPAELREVEEFLARLQASVRRQVILEAKIVEVRLDDGFQAGINWAALASRGSDTVGAVFGSSNGLNTPDGLPVLGGADSNSTGITGAAGPDDFNGVFGLLLNTGNFDAFLELLDSQGEVHVLSSPRVATVNNQRAVIKVGTDEFFVTDISSTTVTGTTTTTSPNVELTPFFSGIALDVTPQIDESGEVILHIHPTVSDVTDQKKEITVGGQAQTVPLALSQVRETDSIVRASNGQVIVIGGLMETSTSRNRSKMPGLGDVPGLGNLFRQRDDSNYKSELVILLRPIVADDEKVWEDYMEESRERIQSMQR
jgi:MSHA biogenesis protein MshL